MRKARGVIFSRYTHFVGGRDVKTVEHGQVELAHDQAHRKHAERHVNILNPVEINFRWKSEQRDARDETETAPLALLVGSTFTTVYLAISESDMGKTLIFLPPIK
jgi:hypothetical protein